VRDIQRVLGALRSPVRREILALVWDREVAAGEIAAAFDVTKPTISQHLAVLRDAGLVTVTTVGTSRRYRARQQVLRGLHSALDDSEKWAPADDIPERSLADSYSAHVVVASVDVETDQETTFAAFVDPELYSRWLGAPVSIVDGAFAATMEWGTEVRGRYELVHPPELIVMRWDFDDDNVPFPGGEMVGYLRVSPSAPSAPSAQGSHVEVHQMVASAVQARFMESAWTLVLGRLKSGIAAATDTAAPMVRRPPRTKRRRSA
jgi:DNA-binding transcriptional ArsR family regulator/uncharacterized protein YndB with AHSA1/START domain